MNKFTLLALALVSATALATLPALAEGTDTSHMKITWQSAQTSAKQTSGQTWANDKNAAAQRESLGSATSDTASQSQTTPQTDLSPSADVAAKMGGAQPSFGPGTTAASRHHGEGTSH